MKTIFQSFALAALVACLAFGQANTLTPTTLAAALSSSSGKTLVVSSASGISAPTLGSTNPATSLYIDQELMSVEFVNSTTITVARGQGGTVARPHASGAYVFFGAPNLFFVRMPSVGGGTPSGACTRSQLQVVPFISVSSGTISDCLGGQWVTGVRTTNANNQYRLMFPNPGSTAYTSINTNGTAVGATTMYCMEADLPYNKLLTGIGVLNGTTVTGNHRYVVLLDAAGNVIANSVLTGQASVTASVYETYAFTSKYYAVGPAQYFACIQDNATGSTTVRMAVTGTNDNVLTAGQTGATFGTIPTLTVPTGFTTAVGPYVFLY